MSTKLSRDLLIVPNHDPLHLIRQSANRKRKRDQVNFIVQMSPLGNPIGYLLFDPPNDEGTLYVHHACLTTKGPDRASAQDAVTTLEKRAVQTEATRILLQCTCDREAAAFWIFSGFVPIAMPALVNKPPTTIVKFEKKLPSPQEESAGGTLPNSRRRNV